MGPSLRVPIFSTPGGLRTHLLLQSLLLLLPLPMVQHRTDGVGSRGGQCHTVGQRPAGLGSGSSHLVSLAPHPRVSANQHVFERSVFWCRSASEAIVSKERPEVLSLHQHRSSLLTQGDDSHTKAPHSTGPAQAGCASGGARLWFKSWVEKLTPAVAPRAA